MLLALGKAALEMVEPQFMRFIIDNVLLNQTLDTASRMRWLNIWRAASSWWSCCFPT